MRAVLLALSCLLITASAAGGADGQPLHHEWSPDRADQINIHLITGGVCIRTADQPTISVSFTNDPRRPNAIVPSVNCSDGVLTITESTTDQHARARTDWLIIVPESLTLSVLDCQSATGDIRIEDVRAGVIASHAATGRLTVSGVRADSVELSTTLMPLRVADAAVSRALDCVSSSGAVFISLPTLPSIRVGAASTSNTVRLKVPRVPEDFTLTMDRNAGSGYIRSPFRCTESSTSRIDAGDTFETTRCLVKRGHGGPDIHLATGSSGIRVTLTEQGQ